jgi:hypothetical protein
MIKADDEDPDDRVGNAIELAIIGNAKRFIKSNAAQRVINMEVHYFLTGFCINKAHGTTTVANACTSPYPRTLFCQIHTSALQYTSMTLTRLLCWITTGRMLSLSPRIDVLT